MKLKKLLSVSNKVLLLFFVTSFILLISFFAFSNSNINIAQTILNSEIYKHAPSIYWRTFDTISWLTFWLGIMGIVFASLITKTKGREDFERSIFTEAFLISLSSMNIITLIFYSSIYLFSFIPSLVIFIFVNSIAFVSAFVLSSLLRAYANSDAVNNSFIKKTDELLFRFGFPQFRLIGLILISFSFFLGLIGGLSKAPQHSDFSFLNYLCFIVGALGVLYFVLGRHYKVKRSGELEKLILLEQGNFVLNFLYFFIFTSLLLGFSFHIEIRSSEFIIIFVPVITISLLLAESKYK